MYVAVLACVYMLCMYVFVCTLLRLAGCCLNDDGEGHDGVSLPEDAGRLGRLPLGGLLLLLALGQLLHLVGARLGETTLEVELAFSKWSPKLKLTLKITQRLNNYKNT